MNIKLYMNCPAEVVKGWAAGLPMEYRQMELRAAESILSRKMLEDSPDIGWWKMVVNVLKDL